METVDIDVDARVSGSRPKQDYPFLSTKLFYLLYFGKLTLRECAQMDDADFMQMPNVGRVTVDELNALLIKLGLKQKPTLECGWKRRLVEGREKAGFTQREVADKVNVMFETYRRYEAPEKTGKGPNLETLVAILEVLDMSADWFLFGKDGLQTFFETPEKGASQ